ncbi:MAG: NYN domain-containing protein [Verrucomicrobia bacterium]|nr:NYN domain-containing protein [Verrucomicrobiota bacterium]
MPGPLSYLLVDGHSVLHAWPELKRHQVVASKRHLARTELLKRLRDYQDSSGTQVVVVFDGTQAQMSEEREKDGLQIIYADTGNSADHIVEKLAAKYAKTNPMRVVSADGMVGETVMAFGADWLSPEMLKTMCQGADKEIQSQINKLKSRRQMLAWLTLGGAGLTLPSCASGSSPKSDTPGEASLIKAAAYCSARKSRALLIQHNGRVIHESYPNGGGQNEANRIFSGTKGFWGLAAMVAIQDGLIRLDEKVADILPQWNKDPEKSTITIEQLLCFTGGLERCLKLHEDGLNDRNQLAMARPLVATPGKSFIYGPSQLQVFHEVLKRKLKKSPTSYLEKHVLSPLGLGSQRYLPDAAGNPLLAAGFVMTARQWAKLGTLLLEKGDPVLKTSSFEKLTAGSQANPAYSFGFWNNRAANQAKAREIDIEDQLECDWNRQSWDHVCLCKDAPPDLIACIGSSYQRLYAIPSRGLVIVRMGQNAKFSDASFLRMVLE